MIAVRSTNRAMDSFREAIGDAGAVCVRGGGTRWSVGRSWVGDAVREVAAPVGVEAFEPAEMTVRVGAGTTLEELAGAIGRPGQEVALDGPAGATGGGALAGGGGSAASPPPPAFLGPSFSGRFETSVASSSNSA